MSSRGASRETCAGRRGDLDPVNVAEVPIETLHTQIFADLASGLGRYDAYQTACWFYGDEGPDR